MLESYFYASVQRRTVENEQPILALLIKVIHRPNKQFTLDNKTLKKVKWVVLQSDALVEGFS